MKTGRGYVYDLYFHIVWCVKYRHKILDGNIKEDFINIIKWKVFIVNSMEILNNNRSK